MFLAENLIGVVDRTKWANTSRILYKYLRRDFSDLEDELQILFPKTWQDRIQRPVPFVYRLARELAILHRRPPSREWIQESGDPFPEATSKRVGEIYKSSAVNGALQTMHEHLVAMNNACLLVWPTEAGGVRLVNIPPYDVNVAVVDPLSNDESDIEAMEVRLPIGSDMRSGMEAFAVAEITPTTAVWKSGPKSMQGKGVFNEDGTNPLGVVPLIMLRGTDPAPGEWFAPAPDDLLAAQRAICLAMTEIGHTAHFQSFGQPVLTGVGSAAAAEVRLGPESILGLPDSDQKFEYVVGSPHLAETQASVESYLSVVLSHLGIRPEIFLRTGAVSATAKLVDLYDRELERERHVKEFEHAELRLWRLINGWITELRGGGTQVFPDAARVVLNYHQPQQPVDPLHAAQALTMAVDLGLTSVVAEYAKIHGVSRDEAQSSINANIEDTKAIRASLVGAEAAELSGRVVQGIKPTTAATEGPAGPAQTQPSGETEVKGAPSPEERELMAEALNGAQVTAALTIVQSVASRALPRESGVKMLVAFFNLPETVAERVMGSTGKTFFVDADEARH